MRTTAGVFLGFGIAFMLLGCATHPAGQQPATFEPAAPAPPYAEVAETYNRRADAIGSLWARSVLRFWYPDREGEERTEQVEGHFQYQRPSNVNLSLSKVGETVGMLGSNTTHYWWIEGRGQGRKAHIGEHAKVTPDRIAELGLPVHPLDLVELVGVTRIPTDLPTSGPGSPSVRWSAQGRELVVNFPIEDGVRRLILDPRTFEPIRIEVADGRGVLTLRSELSSYTPVAVRAGGPDDLRVRVPGEVFATVNEGRTRVRMRLYDPETGGSRPRPAAFDLQRLLQGIQDVVSLDEQPVAAR